MKSDFLKASLAALFCLIFTAAPCQNSKTSEKEIREALQKWVANANAGNYRETNQIWAPDFSGWYRGVNRDLNYADAVTPPGPDDPITTYKLEINEILVDGELAIVRDTWEQKVRKTEMEDVTLVIKSYEVWRRQGDGKWKIARSISYSEKGPK